MSRTQVRVMLPQILQEQIATIRGRWNPERALKDPAHITVIYHDEAPDPELLVVRLRSAAEQSQPFELRVGRPHRFQEPVRGAFLSISDPLGAISAVRRHILAPPFSKRDRFGLHVTVLHPNEGNRIEAAWPEIRKLTDLPAFEVSSFQVVGANYEVLASVELSRA